MPSKRQILDLEEFDFSYLYKSMRSLFPRNNDCASKEDLVEVFHELKTFNIITKKQLRLFLKRNRRWLLIVDQEPLDQIHRQIYREDLGDEKFSDAIRRQYWFCYPALIRNALKRECGESYEKYSNKRDKI